MKFSVVIFIIIVTLENIYGFNDKQFIENGIQFISKKNNIPYLRIESNKLNGKPKLCTSNYEMENEECYEWDNNDTNEEKIRIHFKPLDNLCVNITLEPLDNFTLAFENNIERYGGPEYWEQRWPMNSLRFGQEPYVTQSGANQAITEKYFIYSSGESTLILDSPGFLEQNELVMNYRNLIDSPPYFWPSTNTKFSFIKCTGDDVRKAHEAMLRQNLIPKPRGVPDERMVTHPIWSTWARYKKDINSDIIQKFADEITNNQFNNSQLEIDDFWETCYGSLTFDKNKFPNMKQLTDKLKNQGFRVTLWIHPFINDNCPEYQEAIDKNYFVSSKDGDTKTNWWDGSGGIVDMTNQDAANWWAQRIQALRDNDGIDSFKFDAGESSWMPKDAYLSSVDETLIPMAYTKAYVDKCAEFGNFIEVRSGAKSQDLDIFVRMLDKDSRWGYDNGLRTLITTLLVMNIQGYSFVLPDMIGGNGYGELPSKELFIRWLEANTFMPSLQFSYAPWDYDSETVEISRKYTSLHAQYAQKIMELAQLATETGFPINPPMWWIAPTDPQTFNIDDQFLLGEDLIVAPVVEENARSRDIYLPAGRWKDELRNSEITGPVWLRDYKVELSELAYFTKIQE